MLRYLSKREQEEAQRQGYMCEHLLCLYSMISERTALLNDNFPVFFNSFREADVILFGFREYREPQFDDIQDLRELPLEKLNIITPKPFTGTDISTNSSDWDFHINVDDFDLDLKGRMYKNIRYRLRKSETHGYYTKISREFTEKHLYVLSRFMASHVFTEWDYEEMLSLDRFFKEHEHGVMIEVYRDGILRGFDVIDFFEDTRTMVVPLGIYLDPWRVSDYMMYQDLKFAKEKGYQWLDVGPSCERAGLKSFKEKWFAKPKFTLYTQTITLDPNTPS